MTSNLFTRTIARIVLGSYLTQLFAPVIHASENERLPVIDPKFKKLTFQQRNIKDKPLVKKSIQTPIKSQSPKSSEPLPANIKIVFEKENPLSPTQTGYRLKLVRETGHNQFQEILSKVFETDEKTHKFVPIGWSSDGIKVQASSSGSLLQVISTQKNNKFSINFDNEGKATLQEIKSSRHIDLQTFGSIHADKTIKAHKMSLMGSSFHNNHNFFANYFYLTLFGKGERPRTKKEDRSDTFTNSSSAYFSIGKEAHIYKGKVENQGTIKGSNGSFLNLHGNNFLNKYLGQKQNKPFGAQVIWEGQFSILNGGSIQNESKILPQSKGVLPLHTPQGAILYIDTKELRNLKDAQILAGKSLSIHCAEDFMNESTISSQYGIATLGIHGARKEKNKEKKVININKGTIYGKNKVDLTISQELTNEGKITSADTVDVQGNGILKNALGGHIFGKEQLNLRNIHLLNEGKLLSGGLLDLYYLQTIENKATGIFFAPTVQIQGSAEPSNEECLQGSTKLYNEGCIEGDEQIKIIIPEFENQGKLLSKQGAISLTANQALNADKASISAKKDIIHKIKKVMKNQGDIKAGKTVFLKGVVLGNSGTINGVDKATLNLENLVNQGEISGKNLQLTVWDLVNQGILESDQKLSLKIKNKATNHKVIKAKVFDIKGNYFENLSSEITNSDGSDNTLDELTINLKKLKNTGSLLTKNGSIKAQIIENQNTIMAVKDLKITVQNILRNARGANISSGELSFFGKGKLQNDKGAKIESGGLLSSRIAGIENKGHISARQAISFLDLLKRFENTGHIGSDQSIALKSKSILFNGGDEGIIEGKSGPVNMKAADIINHGLIKAINGQLSLAMERGENAHILYGNDGVSFTIGDLFTNTSLYSANQNQQTKWGVIATPQTINLDGKGRLENKAILKADKKIVSHAASFDNQQKAEAPFIHIRNGTNAGNLNSETVEVGEALVNQGTIITKNVSGNGLLTNLGRLRLTGEEKAPSQISIKAFENGCLEHPINKELKTKQARLVSSFVTVTPANEKFISHEKAKIWGEKFIFETSPKKIIENNGYFKTNVLGINHEGVTFINGPQAVLRVKQSFDAPVVNFQNEGIVKSQGTFRQQSGTLTNTGTWDHRGNIDLGETILENNKGTLIWQEGKWKFGEKQFTNKGTWILDKVICSQPLTMQNYGILHLKDGSITFEDLINHDQLIFTKGRYTLTGTVENNHLMSFLENDWIFTDNQTHTESNHLVLKDKAVQGFTSIGEIESQKNLVYDVKILPKQLRSKQDIFFTPHYQPNRTIEDLQNISASGKVKFYCPGFIASKSYEFSNIRHLDLYVSGLFTTHHSFKAPALTMQVDGLLTCGASNQVMGNIAATHGSLTIVAHGIDNRFGKIFGDGPTRLLATKGNIQCGSSIQAPHNSAKGIGWTYQYTTVVGNKYAHTTTSEVNGSYIASNNSLDLQGDSLLLSYGQTLSFGSSTFTANKKIEAIRSLLKGTGTAHWKANEIYIGRADAVLLQIGWMSVKYTDVYEWAAKSDESEISFDKTIIFEANKLTNLASTISSREKIFLRGTENKLIDLIKDSRPSCFQMTNQNWSANRQSTHYARLLSEDLVQIDIGKFRIEGNMNASNISVKAEGDGYLGRSGHQIFKPSVYNLTEFIKRKVGRNGFLKVGPNQEVTTDFPFGKPHTVPEGQMMVLNCGSNGTTHLPVFGEFNIFNPLGTLSSGLFNLFLHEALIETTGKVRLGENSNQDRDLALTYWNNNQKLRKETESNSMTQEELLKHAKEPLLIPGYQQEGNLIHQMLYLALPPEVFSETRGIVGDNIGVHTGGNLTLENAKVTGKKLVNFFSEKQLKFLSTITTRTHENVTQDFLDSPVEVECTEGPLVAIGKEGFQMTGAKLKSLLRLIVGSTKGNTKIEHVLLNRTEKSEQVEEGGFFEEDKRTQTAHVTTTSQPSELSSGQEEVIVVSDKESGTTSITGSLLKSIVAILFEGKEIKTKAGVGINSTTTSSQTEGMFSSSHSHSVNQSANFFPNQFQSPNIYTNTEIADYHGTDFIADIIYDNTKDGAHFGPTTAWLEFFQQMVTESPFLTSDIGCKGGYEAMQPCRLLVNKIIRNIDDGQIELQSVEWDKNRTEIIGKFAETTYQLKQWQTSWKKTEQLIPNEALVVVALGITIATQGWGASFASGTLGFGAFGSEMFAVGLSTVCSQMGTTFFREGDPLKAAASVFSDHFIRSLGTKLVTTALVGGGGSIEGFTQCLMVNALKSVVKSGVASVIEKRDFGETLKEMGIEAVVQTIGSSIAEKIGQASSSKENPLTYVEHKLAHFAVGASMGTILDHENPLRGAITSGAGAVIGEMVAESLCDRQQVMQEAIQETKKECGQFDPKRYNEIYRNKIQKYIDIGCLVAGSVIAAFKQDPSLGISAATNALANNFATVPEPEMSLLNSEIQEMKPNKIDEEETEEKSKKNTRKTINKQKQRKTRSQKKVGKNSGSEYLEILDFQNRKTHQHQGLYLEMAQEKEQERGRTRDRIQLTSDQEEMRQKYHERMEKVFENDDGMHRSYTSTATMQEALIRREYEKKGVFVNDEEVLRQIFTHRRPPSPTRTDIAFIEKTKITLKNAVPQSIKNTIKKVIGGVEQGSRYVYHQLPEGGQKVVKGSLQFLNQVNESMPTTVRQGLRDLGFSQGFAQDCGDLISFGQWFAPGVGSIKYATKGTNLSKGTKVLRSSVVESLDLATAGTSILKRLESSHLATKILEKIGMQNKEKLTYKMFSFVQNEQGNVKNFGKGLTSGNKKIRTPSPLTLEYEIKNYDFSNRLNLNLKEKTIREKLFGTNAIVELPNPSLQRVKVWNPHIKQGPLKLKDAKTFLGCTYVEAVTRKPTILYRFYGGKADKIGHYWTDICPYGPVQMQIDGAIAPIWGNTLEKIVKIQVPVGEKVFLGLAAEQRAGGLHLVGGGRQVFIEHVKSSWIIE